MRSVIVIHIYVHGRHPKFGFGMRQEGGRNQVISDAISRFGHDVCRCGSDHHQIRPIRQMDVCDWIGIGKHIAVRALSRDRSKAELAHKTLSVCTEDGLHGVPTLAEATRQVYSFVGCNAAAYA